MKKIALLLGSAALVVGPVAAQSLPVAAPVSDGENLGGGSETILIGALIAGIAAMAVLAVIDDDDEPASP